MPADRPAGRRILVVGDVATDVVATVPTGIAGGIAVGTDTEARISIAGGGSAANTAAWLADTGTPVTLIAAVGADEPGRTRIAELVAAGVHCVPEVVEGSATGTVVVLTDPRERTMLCDRGANRRLSADHVAGAVTQATDAAHLHLSAYPLFDVGSRPAARHALAVARGAGLSTSVDAASAGPLEAVGAAAFTTWVRGVDLVLANLDEARVLVGDPRATAADAARALADLAAAVVVKSGAAGALWSDATGLHRVPARPVTALDPTGAGDAFAAGLLAAWAAGADPLSALRAGARSGARAVTGVGARPAR